MKLATSKCSETDLLLLLSQETQEKMVLLRIQPERNEIHHKNHLFLNRSEDLQVKHKVQYGKYFTMRKTTSSSSCEHCEPSGLCTD